MSMLAEPRQKRKKWSKDPRNLNWLNDSTRVSVKLMEKMGWTEGKGLGANLDGRANNIKIDLRPRQLGLGSSNYYGDTWLAHQDGFEAVLQKLQEGSKNPVEKYEKRPVKSLEETSSQQNKLHYAKFTRGKDLSCASENDLKSIFGSMPGSFEAVKVEAVVKEENIKEEQDEEEPKCIKKKSKKKRKKQQQEEEEKEEEKVEMKQEADPFKTSSLSVADYFKNKMYLKKLAAVTSGTYMQCMAELKAERNDVKIEAAGDTTEEKKSEQQQQQTAYECDVIIKQEPVDEADVECAKKKKKKKKTSSTEEKTAYECDVIIKQEPVDEADVECEKKKKKKKKTSSTEEKETSPVEEKADEKKSKKKRKKEAVKQEEETTSSEVEEVKKMEKKKKKKSQAKEEEEVAETKKRKRKSENNDDNEKTVKKSKKNKKKKTNGDVTMERVSAEKKKKKSPASSL